MNQPTSTSDSESAASVDLARWFAEEVQPHEPALRAYLRQKYPHWSDVDDCIQESFLKAFLARKTGRITAAKGFLFHVARNSAVSFFRRRKFISDTSLNDLGDLHVLETDVNVVECGYNQEELDHIADAIASLPDRCRQVVVLRLTQGLEYCAIAQALGVSEPTVRVQLARGIRKCSEFLRARGFLERERT